jgi:Transglutaminase-like superfamily
VKQLRAFARLTHRDQRLLLEAFITLAICRARLRAPNIEKLQAWATRVGNGATAVDHLAWAVEVASRKIPGATCLCRALALQRLLAKNGHGSELRIGVEKNNDQFGAHAWLIYGGKVLIGASQLGKHELLVAWQSKTNLSERRRKDAARL